MPPTALAVIMWLSLDRRLFNNSKMAAHTKAVVVRCDQTDDRDATAVLQFMSALEVGLWPLMVYQHTNEAAVELIVEFAYR